MDINKKVYECIFSMGPACYNAELLTKAKLRTFSSPFDWLCGGSYEQAFDYICNGFNDFLNVEDLEKVGEREYPEHCDIYFNKRSEIYFNHDFPKGEDLQKSIQAVRAKYDSRIRRLNDKLSKSKNSLIVYMSLYDDYLSNEDLEKIQSAVERINQKFGKTGIDVLYIKHKSDMKDNEYNLEQVSKNVYMAELFNMTRDNNGHGNYKNCKNVLSKIKLHKTFSEMLLKISKGRQRVRVYLFGFKIMSFRISD